MNDQSTCSPDDDRAADRRSANLRLALILASVATVFFVGFVAKIALLGGA
ncbi:hypothetical protein ABIC99_002897 [Sphaerotilus sulfidivorans]|jgi:hypothetical protein|uniref:Uncharacterized protein n=1 Tax=Sphaerotilus sulfidivorans TaxID=639200 RepID=A0ABV2ISD3_9BURK|nr:cytochrome oxidase small assembly protein [Sphaerotilus sulfidivorans]MBP8174844.1 cytochrome oxidase small assembly protein [Sphaerotilus sp.]NZD46649.1 hypothetical protein [Sphaerotilus sulfidivorans]GIX53224.1 hypothetical protein CQA4T8M7_24800 [Sphaerotilus natans]